MKLISLLERLEYTCIQGSTDQEVPKGRRGFSFYLHPRGGCGRT